MPIWVVKKTVKIDPWSVKGRKWRSRLATLGIGGPRVAANHQENLRKTHKDGRRISEHAVGRWPGEFTSFNYLS